MKTLNFSNTRSWDEIAQNYGPTPEEENSRLRKEYMDLAKEIGFAALRELFRRGITKQIRIRGYTPGFNDGSPCVHSQSTEVWNQGKGLFDSDWSHSHEEKWDSLYGSCPEIAKVLDGDKVERIFHLAFGTDWQILFRLNESNEVEFDHKFYDCGY